MGDRRMVEIKTCGGSLFVYSHWDGALMPALAKGAVRAAKPRWDDQSYAVRILVDQLTRAGRDQETDYGLMLTPNAEDEYNHDSPSIIIDLPNKQLTIIGGGKQETLSFEEVTNA